LFDRAAGQFLVEGERVPFGPGDVLIAAARVEQRFEGFSEDFASWVVFYGSRGGRAAQSRPLMWISGATQR
jgi:hypothetical protein